MRGAALAAGVAFSWAAPASALEPPPCSELSKRPWVSVVYDPGLDPADAERVRRELGADLGPEGLDVCDASRAGAPVARIVLSPAKGVEGISIHVEIRDALTEKEVSRTLSTTRIPPDGRALAIALAASELLRASWAELALRSAPPPAMPVPATVSRMVDASMRRAPPPPRAAPPPPPPRIVGLSVALAGEAFTSGFARLGADVRASVDLGPRFTPAARVGFRRALATETPDGTVDADAILFGVEGAFALLPRESAWNVDLLTRLDVAEITFHATPAPGVGASSATVSSVEASAGARVRVRLTSSLGLFAEAGAGGPLVAAAAKDGDVTIAGTGGALFFAALAARGSF